MSRLLDVQPKSYVKQLTCDRCGRTASVDDIEFHSFVSLDFDCTWGSALGDGNHIDLDLCHDCVKVVLGPWLRISALGWGRPADWLEFFQQVRENPSTIERQPQSPLDDLAPGAADEDPLVWRYTREGRSWPIEEALKKHDLLPGRLEMVKGQLCCFEDERQVLLQALIETMGMDAALQFGEPELWRAAIRERMGERESGGSAASPFLAKALLRAQDRLGLRAEAVAQIIGCSEARMAKIADGKAGIDPISEEGELALSLISMLRALDTLVGGDDGLRRCWMTTHNSALDGIPAEVLETKDGLVRVLDYLDRAHGRDWADPQAQDEASEVDGVSAGEEADLPRRSWNYRVIRFEQGGEVWRAIHEVHYEDGRPCAYSGTEASISWFAEDEPGAPQRILGRMVEALAKPELSEADFRGGEPEPTDAERAPKRPRQLGRLAGKLKVPENFDAPLPDDVLDDFDGGPSPVHPPSEVPDSEGRPT